MNDDVKTVLLKGVQQGLRRPTQTCHRALEKVPIDALNHVVV
jgi:hypothetical protein